ncbi:cysteine desulfurase family protein [Alkaliphilus hydrothermalis]|uniref:Cysteine desulfurase n=1 Tax=Alkaliphilus hydrothermalis TaxID=1482730 RepID=A0ABS2NPN2_9FIRM|nr:cysteine desulfurase family protein [Alkaliphilus hydrothermalis]MBM7614910.1 cysteine desulfurase [Alkaliphilus hydrothermalis]
MEVYLDNAATTKPRKEVVEAMVYAMEELYANPSSLHRKGVEVEKSIKNTRKLIAKALGCKDQEFYFTSGGTESNNIAIRGIVEANHRFGKHIITSKIEHPSVLNTFNDLEAKGYGVTYLEVNHEGFISVDELRNAMKEDTILVAIMHVNNEVGSIQPIDEIGKIIKGKNPKTLFHVDAIQSFGKIKFNVANTLVDTLAISGHKLHGPKGIGGLYVRKGLKIRPMVTGGGHEMGLRAGTENVPGILGLGAAVKHQMAQQEEIISKMITLKKYLVERIQEEVKEVVIHNGMEADFAPHIINVSFIGVKSEVLLHSLEGDGIYVSSGSACSSKKKGFSHVLTAMKLKNTLIDSSLRLSISDTNTKEEIDYGVNQIKKQVELLRKIMR